MRRIDLVQAATAGWARLTPEQRDRFFKTGLKAALRLDRLEFRAWLLRRVRTAPLAPPVDPAAFAISDRDMAALLKQLPLRANDADRETQPYERFRPSASTASRSRHAGKGSIAAFHPLYASSTSSNSSGSENSVKAKS
ncbi:hypothetical protein [Bradyrhizobium sp. 76]|uniref:hypothetical protein n=1 Tax=Bradyrhizobium sp. 76 TaxID=2782680 RepID=UPI001FFBF42A|nr:hypothetical protein [Bradyrhizobium sp. 76]MCK1404160.1 hypothetical protein [Bradyrhizobium sp. 76]